MRSLAQRLLGTRSAPVRRMSLGSARAFAAKAVAKGKLVLKKRQKSAHVMAVVCPLDCQIVAQQRLKVGRKTYKLGGLKKSFAEGGGAVIKLGKKHRRVLASTPKAKLVVTVQVTDAAGATSRAVKPIRMSVKRK